MARLRESESESETETVLSSSSFLESYLVLSYLIFHHLRTRSFSRCIFSNASHLFDIRSSFFLLFISFCFLSDFQTRLHEYFCQLIWFSQSSTNQIPTYWPWTNHFHSFFVFPSFSLWLCLFASSESHAISALSVSLDSINVKSQIIRPRPREARHLFGFIIFFLIGL